MTVLISVTPPHGGMSPTLGWDPALPLTVVFDRSPGQAVLDPSSFVVRDGNNADIISVATYPAHPGWDVGYSVAGDQVTCTMIPTGGWLPSTQYGSGSGNPPSRRYPTIAMRDVSAPDTFTFFNNVIWFETTTAAPADVDPPTVSAVSPAEGSTIVGSAPIVFRVTDVGSGVDTATLNAWVTQGPFPEQHAVVDGVIQAEWAGPAAAIVADGDSVLVTLDSPASLAIGHTITVRVTCDDLAE